LAEGIKFKRALDPRKTVVDGSSHRVLVVGVAAMEAGLATVISCAQLIGRDAGSLTEPKFSLGGVARKDDVGELLDLLAHRCVGGLPQA
jgi:hypothetical protein